DRPAGEAESAGGRARRPRPGRRDRQAAREDSRRQRRRADRLPGAPELLRAARRSVQRIEREPRGVGVADREPGGRGDRSAADHARTADALPARGDSGADAVYVLALTRREEEKSWPPRHEDTKQDLYTILLRAFESPWRAFLRVSIRMSPAAATPDSP